MKKYELGFLTTTYVAMLTVGVGIFAAHPSWTGLAALLLFVPGIAFNLAFPARRKAVRA